MSRSRIALLAVAPLVAMVVVALVLLHREQTRDYGVGRPPPPPSITPTPQLKTPPPTSPAIVVTLDAPTTAPVVVAPPPASSPPPSSSSPPTEDGVALLPQVKPPAGPALVENATDTATFVAFARGGRLLVARASGRLQFIDPATGQRQAIDMKLAPPRAVALSPAGDRVAVANAESADVWHVASSRKTHLAAGDVTAMRFGRGDQLYTGHAGGEVKVWTPPSWTSSTTLRPNVGGVTQIVESPASAHLAVIGASGGVAICDVGDHAVKQRLGADQAWASVAFAPDGRTLAAAGPRGVAMWDTILWRPRPAPGGTEAATHVAFWRGGTVLVTATADGAIRIHDLATRQLMMTLGGGKGPFASIDFADDGRTIAASDANGVAIWDATTRAARQLDARP